MVHAESDHPEDAGQSYRATLDSLLEGFQIIGRDFTYLYVNPAAARQGRSTPEALEGRKMWEAYPGFDQTPLFAELGRCMTERVAHAVENLFTFSDGSERWFELRVEPVPAGLCIHSVDIDDRKKAQAALHELNMELEQRVADRTRELEELNAELDAFAYGVSHDLRAPVRHVLGFAGALAEAAGPGLDPDSLDCLGRITSVANRMNTMIDALLAFSRLGRTPLQVQPVDLSSAVVAAWEDLEPECAGRNIVWDAAPLPTVPGDPALLRLALTNLLSNAIKYSRGRSPARISVGSAAADGTREATIWVRDNGVGFDDAGASKLFGVFQRLHSEAEFEGTGIGLANVRRIVARHGGRVWAEGRRDEGATFYVALPLLSSSAEGSASPTQSA